LIATKAARVCHAAKGDPVLEFGLRRAQGIDGAVSASRAAYIGGCAATSNVLAGKIFGIPVKGTHAHSWIMCFVNEQIAFEEYAKAMPNNCVFLVDTYDTIEGVKIAIETGKHMQSLGHKMVGIRLDSGDLAHLSTSARELLDDAGFHDAAIVASNDLDEHAIESLKAQGAPISVWGVGTKLSTAYDQPALGGVYKLSAIRPHANAEWEYKVKLSEQAVKTSTPGILQVRRIYKDNKAYADIIYSEENPPDDEFDLIDNDFNLINIQYEDIDNSYDLLQKIFAKGKIVQENYVTNPTFIKQQAAASLAKFTSGVKRLVNPDVYLVGLETHLYEKKQHLIRKLRGQR